MGNKNRRRGKDAERAVARLLNGLRVGILGKADVITEQFAIEVKERGKLPALIMKAYQQAQKNTINGKIPIVVLHQLGSRHEDDFVMMKLSDFLIFSGAKR